MSDLGQPLAERFSPTLVDLIGTVRDFLKDAPPGRGLGYEGNVARYLLDMSVRELEAGAALDRNSAHRLATLLAEEAPHSRSAAGLCRAIRAGGFDDRWEEILDVLLEESVERVAIVRPDVLAPEHARRRP